MLPWLGADMALLGSSIVWFGWVPRMLIKPKRLFPLRCKLWPFRRGLDEYADEATSG